MGSVQQIIWRVWAQIRGIRPGYQVIWGAFTLWVLGWAIVTRDLISVMAASGAPLYLAAKFTWLLSRHPRP